jgi:hypothetical protein
MKLNHQNIAKVDQLFKAINTAFIFMDYVENDFIENFMQKNQTIRRKRIKDLVQR